MSIDEEVRKFLAGRKCCIRKDGDLAEVDIGTAIDAVKRGEKVLGSIEVENSRATPALAIEFEAEVVRVAFSALKMIVEFVKKNLGLDRSLYVVISKNLFEIRVVEQAIPEDFFMRFGLREGASLVVQYTLKKLRDKLYKICLFTGGRIRFIDRSIEGFIIAPFVRIDNTLTRFVKPEALDTVSVSLGKPIALDHDNAWCLFSEDEGHRVAEVVSREAEKGVLKPFEIRSIESRRIDRVHLPKVIGRFEVMALLQAARYYLLTGDLEKAKSFGLNRAIFYAYLKYHGREVGRSRIYMYRKSETQESEDSMGRTHRQMVVEDEVQISPRGWFVMGDQEQLPEDFDRQIRTKFDAVLPFDLVWHLAIDYVKRFPENIIRNPNRFFKYVYEPVRDSFFERVVIGEGLEELVSNVVKQMLRTVEGKRSGHEGRAPPITRLTAFMKKNSQ